MNFAKRTAIALAGLLAAAALAFPAQAVDDTTPPVIDSDDAAAFVVGSTINASDPTVNNTWDRYTGVQALLKWSVTDDSGFICAFDLYEASVSAYYPPDPDPEEFSYYQHLLSAPTQQATPYAGQYIASTDDYDGELGGGGDADMAWVMTAEDCAGNTARFDIFISRELSVLQENNTTASRYQDSGPTDPGRLTYTGTWGNVSCACASGAAMKNTKARGASFTFTRTYERDDHVALVMAKGPSRGSADVYVDGVKKATINTYASTVKNRVVVYDKWMPAGTHTVKVVNLATSGRSRIDLDAVLTN